MPWDYAVVLQISKENSFVSVNFSSTAICVCLFVCLVRFVFHLVPSEIGDDFGKIYEYPLFKENLEHLTQINFKFTSLFREIDN